MAGGLVKYRHLSRKSSARQALLRGLVTELIHHEHIQTTYAKAKEAQRLAEKLISYAKRNNEETRRKAQAVLYEPIKYFPKLFGTLKERYANRPGGYTRVLRTEPKNTYDQAPSAILELVDGRHDTRFAMTAKAMARDRIEGRESTELTLKNKEKVTRYRKGSKKAFGKMVNRFETMMKREAMAEREMDEERQMQMKKKEQEQEQEKNKKKRLEEQKKKQETHADDVD